MQSSVRACLLLPGPSVTSKTTYEGLRAEALKAGRFSAFEAGANQHAASLFTELCRDPTIETFDLGYPWTGVRRKDPTP